MLLIFPYLLGVKMKWGFQTLLIYAYLLRVIFKISANHPASSVYGIKSPPPSSELNSDNNKSVTYAKTRKPEENQ
jgi:hypothetical protein